jgi:hypothetical protein
MDSAALHWHAGCVCVGPPSLTLRTRIQLLEQAFEPAFKPKPQALAESDRGSPDRDPHFLVTMMPAGSTNLVCPNRLPSSG